jgi:hypothetical protein
MQGRSNCAAAERIVPMPLDALIHQRLTATVATDRDDHDWASLARETSSIAKLKTTGGRIAHQRYETGQNCINQRTVVRSAS